ncbi:MAG: carbonic anhydrase [Methanobacteriota archaeon]|nr:MAG: carbonic anhydrase [Euryarchaeota archaeon]
MREEMNPKRRLIDGNATFRRATDPSLLSHLAESNEPFFAILTCSDARMDPAKIFSLSMGDAFVVRTAGNIASGPCVVGSLEYAVEFLKVKALVVLGHSDCGLIRASYERAEYGYMEEALKDIECAKSKLSNDDVRDADAIAANNVRIQMRKLVDFSPIIRDAASRGDLEMLGAVLDIRTGEVKFVR